MCTNYYMTDNNETNFSAALIVFSLSLGISVIFYSLVGAWKLSPSLCYYPLPVCEMPEELQWVGAIDSLIWSHANCQRTHRAEGVKMKRGRNNKSLKNTFTRVCRLCHHFSAHKERSRTLWGFSANCDFSLSSAQMSKFAFLWPLIIPSLLLRPHIARKRWHLSRDICRPANTSPCSITSLFAFTFQLLCTSQLIISSIVIYLLKKYPHMGWRHYTHWFVGPALCCSGL